MSRTTGDTWIDRYGPRGLGARSRPPGCCPRQAPDHGVAALRERRPHHPAWGAKTRLSILEKRPPHWHWPARSTGGDILGRSGVRPRQRHRRHRGHPGKPTALMAAPQDVWTAAFTGHVSTGDGSYCHPRTGAAG